MKIEFKPVIVLILVGAIAAAALAFFNDMTKDAIAAQNAKIEAESLQTVMSGIEATQLDQSEVDALNLGEDLLAVYHATKDGEDAGYIFKTATKGYAGDVVIMTGISVDEQITGAIVLTHSETAGLGANAAVVGEGAWINQFAGKPIAQDLVVQKSGATQDNEIDAITSSTITSRGVVAGVNIAIAGFNGMVGK